MKKQTPKKSLKTQKNSQKLVAKTKRPAKTKRGAGTKDFSTKIASQFSSNPLTKSIIKRADQIDQIILKLTAKPVGKLLKQFEKGKKRLDAERRLALELGTQVLTKAKEVRDTLIQKTRVTRGD